MHVDAVGKRDGTLKRPKESDPRIRYVVWPSFRLLLEAYPALILGGCSKLTIYVYEVSYGHNSSEH